MALLRNREVQILGKTDGEDVSPTYTVMYKDSNRENVKLSELQLTEEEHRNLSKAHGEAVMTNVNVVKDKDLQELRDGQDKAKIEARQAKDKPQDVVEVKRVLANRTEVTPAQVK